ncbi:OPT family small oligopeptide transporter [Kwoniella bestiolae CBS 10118]|uniref:OPT family small oligopeptide transporter n=1 Tax=Kwoniella bestiolae CBS 10118 TaxID=1296100 RepID=A0A1B9GEZ4_9TREE|nr:OPT family small oligopeptide transporter [Kwoniella bestiolae CBS 10118]OCF29569.1 OPT family small oligopeptide transporter [Kwoniella bestiolae CBS 10118]
MSDPSRPGTSSGRPTTSSGKKRVSTGRKRRQPTARLDTAASGISADELPEQEFYKEGDDEDDEDFDEEEDEEDEEVFAFHRPTTAAVPALGTISDYSTSQFGPSSSHLPTTAGTTSNFSTGPSDGHLNTPGLSDTPRSLSVDGKVPTPTGVIDVGGHLPELTYDKSNPPPFSGRYNPNNSSFAFTMSSADESNGGAPVIAKKSRRPHSGASLMDRLNRRRGKSSGSRLDTGTTNFTTTTDMTMSMISEDSGASEPGLSYRPTTSHHNKRMKSSAPLISESDLNSESGRGWSRGSYGMTELTGDMTIPDGKTTWGDGLGGLHKEASENGEESLGVLDPGMVEEDSPYPEVRASVSNIDDPEMPALTFRAWLLGLFFVIIGSGINTFFHFRTPAPYLSPLIVQVIVYPVGKFVAWSLPITTWTLPRFLGGSEFTFNPGPFNIKEHTVIVMMANVAIGPAYALYATVSSELYYKHKFGYGFDIMLILATQLTGFTMAGICRRFVVWPASMIWPGNLVVTTNLNTLHAEEDGFQGGMSRLRFLLICMGGAFAYYFFPGFIFTALSYFSYACWIAPKNKVVNQLFGISTGLGMGILTFDWTQITWIGSPLTAPWWAEVNVGVGFILFFWILVPILYYNNVWEFAYLPVNVIQAADRFGSAYDIFNILTPDIRLNTTAYAAYSPVYLSATFSMTFMLAFALATALLVHTALYHGPRIYRAVINIKTEADDIHMKLMKHYPEVPDWWYLALFAVVFTLAVTALEVYHTDLPVWGYIVAVLLPFVYIIPSAFIYAMTSQQPAINLLAELIPGYMFKGQPIPGMLCKVFTVQTVVTGLLFIQDLKLGHYMKVPPRATFVAQLTATVVACFIQSATKELMFAKIPDMCAAGQKSLLTCASTKVFFTSSIIWGLIGPDRLFSKGSLYHPQTYALIVGAVLPIPFWLWVRRYPKSIFRNLNLPVVFSGALYIPPASGINYSSWLLTGFIFQFWLRRKQFAWWSKYNYVLSAALDVGTALSAIAIFLFLGLPGASINWWGNTVYQKTADWDGDGASYLTAPETGFGPDTWKL